ncbi:alkylation response protein AidB-like acyl-CoA dehydrogenase [Streptomyces umbrinus]|uniref:Alkylation response protein AidB-like acyl-CoA dehydrogenase n=1 Tax=Streptomyces umbrinus TaxID=67370 RepID=A0ABU0SIJ1_9ACTN|nr:acyl-CoA dehydrogenase family protein [Streptomyces umbrinus]MDQ1023369.1 alkylation response protein AidB-like acyl-CoA dehydrogenase [Streptomyces umbrinus]
MELDFGPAVRDFRDELRDWLAEHLMGEFAEHRGVGGPTDGAAWEVRLAWDRELAAGNWLGVGWPREYGGRGLGLLEEIVFEYEYARANAPYRATGNALDLLGPMLLAMGSEAQKKRFLPPILSVEELWGQGFSEPGAGSDLASVRTRAERDDGGTSFEGTSRPIGVESGGEWVVNGQKVWTSFGIHADWLYVLTRTDPDSRRHKGLTMLLVPADQPGVEIRSIRNLAGQDEFAEVFLSDARTDADMVVGEVGQGWRTAMATLGIERGTTLLPQQLAFEREAEALIGLARERGALDDPMLRRRIVDAWISVRIMRTTNLRTIAELTAGRAPGPQATTAKLYASTRHQQLGHLAMELAGPAGQIVDEDYALDTRQRSFLLSLAETIYGGSSEIQRNIIGEQVLGLPKEPRP